jgi:hypothetical protein
VPITVDEILKIAASSAQPNSADKRTGHQRRAGKVQRDGMRLRGEVLQTVGRRQRKPVHPVADAGVPEVLAKLVGGVFR